MSDTSKQVMILGRGRSGTSVMGQVLTELGFDMGDSRPPGKNNPWGYFEDKRFNELVDSFLPGEVHYKDQDLILNHEEFEKGFQRYVAERETKLWGFKNGSGLYFLPIIIKHLPNPYFIVCYRNLESQTQSVQFALSTLAKSLEQCKQSIENYNYKMELFFGAHDLPRLDVWYEELVKNQQREVKKIANFLGVPYKKVKGINPKLKHF